MKNEEYGVWICAECGYKYGKKVIDYSTYHYDICEYCGKITSVTEIRDWNYPKLPKDKK